MTQDETVLSKLTSALFARGFDYVGRTAEGWPRFRGSLSAAGAEHVARVAVDLTGLELPRVYVDLPAAAPAVLAHVGANGFVCFAAKGSLVLDIFDIPGQVLGCLDRAAMVLDLSLRGEMQDGLEDEFFACWGGELCFLDVEPGEDAELSVFFDDSSPAFVSSNQIRTQRKLKAMKVGRATSDCDIVAFQVKTTAKPKPMHGAWPPTTVSDLLAWQARLDPRARRAIERCLLKACVQRKRMALCVVKSPLTQYAFWVHLDVRREAPAKALAGARSRLFSSKVHQMTAVRIDDDYVSRRNAPSRPTLAGKRLALIGCGTIGGFLAELLVKAGAGLAGGELLLVDHDILLPQNVGRHRLGLDHALVNKAEGLRADLSAGAPSAVIRALPVRVQEAALGKLDLLIDATGEEALSAALTRQLTDVGTFVPTLTTWVEGPGVAVRALLRDASERACTRCMCGTHGQQLYPVVEGAMPDDMAGHGCESLYVPFPATVSVQAACLTADLVSDWLEQAPSPRLRTRLTRRGFRLASNDVDIPHLEECPACRL